MANSPSKNPETPLAISLQYEGDGAPVVTAKGRGAIAEQILQCAKEHDIPIKQDSDLVELLGQVELDQEIPQALYEAVAQVLIFAYELSGKTVETANRTEKKE